MASVMTTTFPATTNSAAHTLDRRELDSIAMTVEAAGVAAVDPRYVATLVEQARAAGVSPTLVEVLVGRHEPAVARARAFGRIAGTLVARAA